MCYNVLYLQFKIKIKNIRKLNLAKPIMQTNILADCSIKVKQLTLV